MEKVNIASLKNQLSRYVRRVRNGAHYLVTDHGAPVAKLVPLDSATSDSLLDRMERYLAEGVVGQYCLSPRFGKAKPLALGEAIASRIIREDRDTRL